MVSRINEYQARARAIAWKAAIYTGTRTCPYQHVQTKMRFSSLITPRSLSGNGCSSRATTLCQLDFSTGQRALLSDFTLLPTHWTD